MGEAPHAIRDACDAKQIWESVAEGEAVSPFVTGPLTAEEVLLFFFVVCRCGEDRRECWTSYLSIPAAAQRANPHM